MIGAALAAAFLAGCGSSGIQSATPKGQSARSGFAGVALNPPYAEPDFALRDQTGARFELSQFREQTVLVTFLYTHCPDVCPLIAANLSQALRTLRKPQKVAVLAVSVDPKGDSARSVRAYVKAHHLVANFHYLIGTRSQLERVWHAYHVAVIVRKGAVVPHSAYTVLVDQRGRARVIYDSHIKARDVEHDVRLLL